MKTFSIRELTHEVVKGEKNDIKKTEEGSLRNNLEYHEHAWLGGDRFL